MTARPDHAAPAARAPAPPGTPLLGHLAALGRDPLGMLLGSFRAHGDVVRLRFALMPAFLVAHPDHLRRVLRDNASNYSKRTRSIDAVRQVLGQGLITAEGELWRRQRAFILPAFRPDRIARHAATMAAAAGEMLEGWEPRAAAGEALDVAAEMAAFTQRVVGATLLGSDLREDLASLGPALNLLQSQNRQNLYRLFPHPDWLPTPTQRRIRAAKAGLEAIVARIIAGRRRAPEGREDLLSLLLQARDAESGEGMSDRQLRDEVMTFLLAGHETTANALSWTWLLLARHPDVRRRVEQEARRVLAGRVPDAASLARLPYTTMVLRESMRLYPPVWALSRRAEGADTLGGFAIPRGAVMLLSPYVTHRHPDFWDDPEAFDPERFAPARQEARPRFAYFPFGGGPRKCIGEGFAMMEARLVLAMAAQRFRLELEPGHPVEPQPSVTLRPLHGLRMRVARVGRD